MSSYGHTLARCLPRHWSIVSSNIDCSRPHLTDIDEPPFQFIHTMDLSAVDTMLYDGPDLVIHRIEIWSVWRPQLGRKKVWHFLTQQFSCCMCVAQCAGALSCWNKVVTRNSAYCWQQYDVSKKYHQNFLLCNNNEITACIADLLNSLLWRSVCGCIFSVMQQQTIGKVVNSIMLADYLCLRQWKNY